MKKILFLHLLFIILCVSVDGQEKQHPEVNPLQIGEDMPPFQLKGVDEKVYTEKDFGSYPLLVVIFTCNHCPTAQAYEQRIKDLYSDFNENGVGFVAISPNSNEALSLAECGYTDLDDSFESMQIRARDIDLPFPYLYDGATSETSIKFGPVATPHVFIFDSQRKLRYRGRIDDMESPYKQPSSQDTRNAIVALLKGDEVPLPTTKTFGCSIKWPWKDQWTKELIKRWEEEPVMLKEAGAETLKEIVENEGESLRLINIWATYCGPCRIEFPDLVDTYRMYSGRGFELFTISMDRMSNKEGVLAFLTDQNASVDNYIWSGTSAYDAIDIIDQQWQGALPYTLLIRPDGEVVYRHEGPVDLLLLRKAVIGELGRYFADD